MESSTVSSILYKVSFVVNLIIVGMGLVYFMAGSHLEFRLVISNLTQKSSEAYDVADSAVKQSQLSADEKPKKKGHVSGIELASPPPAEKPLPPANSSPTYGKN